MKTKFEIYTFLILIIVIIPFQISAQETTEGVAKVKKIVEGEKEHLNLTSRAKLRRSDQINWQNVKKNDRLFFEDNLKLEKNIWLNLQIKNKSQNANLDFFTNEEQNEDTLLTESGRYKIIEDQNEAGKVAIEMQHGLAIINVLRDAIRLITSGLTSSVESGSITRAFYLARPDETGEIYLQQGHLTFPGNSEFPGLKNGQVAFFQNGEITSVFYPDALMTTKYNDIIKYNNSTVWKKPLLKKPVTWIGTAAVAIGTTLIITKPWDKKVNVTVNINMVGK